MCRAYTAILLALSLVLIQAPIARSQGPEPSQTQPQNTARPSPTPPDKHVEKIKRAVQKIKIGSRITVFLNNGDELHGALTLIDADSFQVAEIDLHQVFTLQYKYVKKVRSGYDGINLFTGKRVSHPKGLKIGIFAAVMFVALGLPIIILASAKD